MSYLTLFEALARKRVVILKEYPVNTLTQLVVTYMFFAAIFFGGQAVAGPAFTDTLPGIIVGFFVWTMAITAFAGSARSIMQEAQWGTLEQLFMSPFGFGRVMLGKTAVNLAEAFLWGAVTLAFMLLVTGQSLALDPLTVLPLGVLAVMPAVGVGFVFGGLAIRFKRIENAFQLVQFLFIGLISAPVGEYPVLKWLPLAQGSYLLRWAMEDGTALWELPADELGVLVVTAALYLGLGYAAFTYCQRWARSEGVMGHY